MDCVDCPYLKTADAMLTRLDELLQENLDLKDAVETLREEARHKET